MPELTPTPNFSSMIDRAVAAYSSISGPHSERHPTRGSGQSAQQPVTSANFRRLALSMLQGGLDLLAETVPGGRQAQATGLHILSAGMRSVVLRVNLRGLAPDSVILKYFRRKDFATNSGGFGYLREKHGLAALSQIAPGLYPHLYAASDSARLLVLEDATVSLGVATVSLGDILGGRAGTGFTPPGLSGPGAATRPLLTTWVDTWAGVLGSPAQAAAQHTFVRALAQADRAASAPGAQPSPRLACKGLVVMAERAGLPPDSAKVEEWRQQVQSIMYPAPGDAVLSSGDFSPANLLISGTGYLAYSGHRRRAAPGSATHSTPTVRAVDTEGTCLHHWALPVAELLLGFPSWPAGPVPGTLVESELWQQEAQRFYGLVAPAPLPDVHQDERVMAAVLAVRAILAEQLQ